VSTTGRAVNALEAVYRGTLRACPDKGSHGDVIVSLDEAVDVRVRWLSVGWPRQVANALHGDPRPDILVAPSMSPGARKAARDAGVGWVDETGAADIYVRDPSSGTTILIETKGIPPVPLDPQVGWRRTTLAVCEAILTDAAIPTLSSVMEATGISTGSAVDALKFLETHGHLSSGAARGPGSARNLVDRDALLDAYADAADHLRAPTSAQIGVLWRDPITGTIETGRLWDASGVEWAATSALSASLLAPTQTEVAPFEIYVSGRTPGDLQRAALAAGLQQMRGGRLLLRPFPTSAGTRLSQNIAAGFRSMPWPRVYADLRTSGVRGEDAAEHLREEMTST
jgi:hypothetical protein